MFVENREAEARRARRTKIERSSDVSHQEWLLDRALEETFPASDPISPMSAQSFA
jgi:hypothetical protein